MGCRVNCVGQIRALVNASALCGHIIRNKTCSDFKHLRCGPSNPWEEPCRRNFHSKPSLTVLSDDYYVRASGDDRSSMLLGATRNKFKGFKEIVYINFTEEKELESGDYLFSVEDSKTLYDFYSPVNCKLEEVNSKFARGATEEVLKDLLEDPEGEDNYLVRVRLKED